MNDLGSLSQCLVDSDPESLGRAQLLRRKALTISLVLEVGMIAGMLLWPLITPGVLPRQYNFVPVPPYHGGVDASAKHSPRPPRPQTDGSKYPPICVMCAPPAIPPHVQNFDGSEPPNFDGDPAAGTHGDPGLPGTGPGLPGGFETGSRLPVTRPPEPPHESGPIRKGEGVMQAMLIHRVQPEYPAIARAAHISGTVQLRAIIGKDGIVRELEVISGNPLLAQSAKAAVREWRYRPTLLNREPVEVETYITVNFILE
jgi:periplasmic protein TonB